MTKKTTEEIMLQKTSLTISKVAEIAGCITALVGASSLLYAFLIQYIGMGRCLYFDFDMDYFDFSLSNTSLFMFVFGLIAGAIGVVLGVTHYMLLSKFCKFIDSIAKKHKLIINFFVASLMVIVSAIITYLCAHAILPVAYANMFFSLVILVDWGVFGILQMLWVNLINGRRISAALLISYTLVTIVIAASLMNTEYQDAVKQKVFPIIDQNEIPYVVISEGKKDYSAYQCKIEDNSLCIITDKHKYFSINNTDTTMVEFNKIYQGKSATVSADQYKESKNHK